LSEVQSRLPRQWNGGQTPGGSGPTAKLHVRQIALPLDASLASVWELINETALPRATRAAWQANGLRLGLLNKNKVAEFKQGLPDLLGHRFSTLYTTRHPSPMIDSPPLRQPYRATVAFQDQANRVQRLTGGRMQMLVKAQRDSAGRLFVYFTPHHYKRQLSVKPRDPLEKQLDGTVFNELTIRLPAPRRQYILLGLHRPAPPEESEPAGFTPRSAQTQRDGDQSASAAAEMSQKAQNAGKKRSVKNAPSQNGDGSQKRDGSDQKTKPSRVGNHMGGALLTGRQVNEPRQLMLIIDVSQLQ
jgi:hypothetical protein